MNLPRFDRRTRARIVFAVLAFPFALLSTTGNAATQSQFEEDFDDPYKPWEEIALQLPDPPQEQNLLPFEVSATTTHSFAVDAKSLSTGTDGVVRYTLVTRSSAGARNVSYEGIRCATGEVKLYAFGRDDGSWSRSRRDRWEPINRTAANRHHAVLARSYMCQEAAVSGPAEQIVYRMRQGISLDPSTTH